MRVTKKCLFCKGRYPKEYCNNDYCPLYRKTYNMLRIKQDVGEEFATESRTPFVGRTNYPNVNLGILAPNEESEEYLYDDTKEWVKRDLNVNQIVDLRSKLINSNGRANVKIQDKFVQKVQELSIGSKPLNVDVKLKSKPKVKLNFSPEIAPYGARAKLDDFEIISNPKVPRAVDKVISDDDLKAEKALNYLRKKDINEDYLVRLFSVGTLGVKEQRKLVPTRWSITAVDDMLFKGLLKDIKYFSHSDYTAFYGSYMEDNLIILFFPGPFRFELFEMLMGNSDDFTHDFEDVYGRKNYAESTAGGYYAVRLAVAEKLFELKRQASVLVLRFISEDYPIPLGVWVLREATRKALKRQIKFYEKELMMNFAILKAKKSFRTDVKPILKKSKVIRAVKQKTLEGF